MNTNHKRSALARWIAPLGALAGVMAVAGCTPADSGGGNGDGLMTVDVAYTTTSVMNAAPFLIAQDQGFFEAHGCQLGQQVEEAVGGANTLRSVIDGGLHMGEVATNAVMDSNLAGTPVTAVGSSHQLPYDFWYAVMPDSTVNGVEDLRGGRLGFTSPGSASEDMAYLITDAASLSPDDLEIMPTSGMGGGIAMLEGGDVDATLMIPLLYEQDPDKYRIAFEALDYIDAYQKGVYIVSDSFMSDHPDAVRCVLAGIDEGMRFIMNDPEAAAAIYAANNEDFTEEQLVQELNLAVQRGAFEGTVGFNPAGLESVAKARELRTGDELKVPWHEIFDGSFLPEGVSTELPE